ncbi:hypothetical protein [Pseudomonas sp. DTU12.3]|nr:hypothetical protein [Pseudomonas sp. DTU12.3]
MMLRFSARHRQQAGSYKDLCRAGSSITPLKNCVSEPAREEAGTISIFVL